MIEQLENMIADLERERKMYGTDVEYRRRMYNYIGIQITILKNAVSELYKASLNRD